MESTLSTKKNLNHSSYSNENVNSMYGSCKMGNFMIGLKAKNVIVTMSIYSLWYHWYWKYSVQFRLTQLAKDAVELGRIQKWELK